MGKRWRKVVLSLLITGLVPMAWGLNSASLTVAGSEQQVSGGWDQGRITVEFNGFQETVQYGQFSSAASVASALAGRFSNDYLSQGLCAIASGAQITFKLQGTATFGALDVGGSTSSFQIASPTGFSSEVSNADTGTVTLTVNGVTAATTTYGEGSTDQSVADGLAAGIQPGSPVSIDDQGNGTLELSSNTSGSTTNYSYLITSQSTAGYATPSFSGSPSSGALEGGADANTTGAPVYSYTVAYQPNSTVGGYYDSVMGTWAFTYDTLNRLATGTQGQRPSPPSGFQDLTQQLFQNYCWSYDQWGNRTDEEGSATAYPGTAGGAAACSSQPPVSYNTNNQVTGSGAPGYDQAGDTTSDAQGRQYLYDAEGRICAVKSAAVDGISAMTGYIYDADGNRVAKGTITSWSCDPTTNGFETSGNETDYVLNQSGQTVTETTMAANGTMQWSYTNVYANGALFATYDAQGLHFLLNDWLGTRRASTDYEGVLESLCASLPYGDQLTCSGSPYSPNEQHFTGKTHDQESGNDYFGARYYSENNARFLTPDWSAKVEPVPYAKLDDPQSLNLYEYVGDNPLGGSDPDGHFGDGPGAIFSTGGGSQTPSTINNDIGLGDEADPDGLNMSPDEVAGYNAYLANVAQAQQQNGDPTLPTEVQPPPPSLADKVETALMPKTPFDAALLFGTDGLGEAGAALSRVLELSSAMGKTADYVTLAVTETKEGTTVVSSSEKALRPSVRALLQPGEVAANGAGHAEVTGVNAAREMGLTPTGVAASRGICPSCADFLRSVGVAALSALKGNLFY